GAFRQFRVGLANQGVPWTRTGQIAVNALSRQAQAGAPLEPELTKPLPANFVLQGDSRFLTAYNSALQRGTTQGLTGQRLQKFAENYVWKHIDIVDLLTSQWIDKNRIPPVGGQPGGTPPPPPPPIPPIFGQP